MSDELTRQALANPHTTPDDDPSFEIVYEVDAKLVSKAYKRFLWKRARRPILIASAIALACLIAVLTVVFNIFLVLGAAYPAAYVVLWFTQIAHLDETYEALQGRKVRVMFDSGGIASYFGNTFKRVQWPGVARIELISGYYFIYYERDPAPGGGFPRSAISEEAIDFVRRFTTVVD
ncbi:MAG: hypothetical protein ACI8XO_000130 [Verrucomicrobiales bacterium]|jgi:hypothetical protein